MSRTTSEYIDVLLDAAKHWLHPSVANGVLWRSPYLLRSEALENGHVNVHRIGIGFKKVQGAETSMLAMRFHVIQKLKDEDVVPEKRIPRIFNGIPTDVIESSVAVFGGSARAEGAQCSIGERTLSTNPVQAGTSIGHSSLQGTGTLGWFCRSTLPGESAADVYVLSNNHVLAAFNAAQLGDVVFHPASGDHTRKVAKFHRCKDLAFGIGGGNRVDAAIAKLTDLKELTIRAIGPPVLPVVSPTRGMRVIKRGVGTCTTIGIIREYPMIQAVAIERPQASDCEFVGQMSIESEGPGPFCDDGDSGALILREHDRAPVGLLFGRSKNEFRMGFANPLDEVLNQLKIELLPAGV